MSPTSQLAFFALVSDMRSIRSAPLVHLYTSAITMFMNTEDSSVLRASVKTYVTGCRGLRITEQATSRMNWRWWYPLTTISVTAIQCRPRPRRCRLIEFKTARLSHGATRRSRHKTPPRRGVIAAHSARSTRRRFIARVDALASVKIVSELRQLCRVRRSGSPVRSQELEGRTLRSLQTSSHVAIASSTSVGR